MESLFRAIKMQSSIVCALLIGLLSIAAGQMQGQAVSPDLFGGDKTMFVDPLMEQRCEKKGINVHMEKAKMTECIKGKTMEYISSGKLKNMREAFAVVCKVRGPIEPCMDAFVNEIEKCYDNEKEKKEVSKAKDVMEATFDYMCKDDAEEMISVFTDMDNIMCIQKMADQEGMMKCVMKLIQKVHPDEMHLQNEETCMATFQATRCMLEPLKSCEKMDMYNFLRGMMDATMGASQCEQYVGHLLSSAAAPSYSVWMLLSISFAYLFFKF